MTFLETFHADEWQQLGRAGGEPGEQAVPHSLRGPLRWSALIQCVGGDSIAPCLQGTAGAVDAPFSFHPLQWVFS
jgi:hypothetical protein